MTKGKFYKASFSSTVLLLFLFGVIKCISGSCSGETTSLYYSGEMNASDINDTTSCNWILYARPKEKIFITFTNFSMENGSVEITDISNASHIIGQFTGFDIPPVVVSCGSSISLSFNSNSSSVEQGFSATFYSKLTFMSNGYPHNYSNEESQHWLMCGSLNLPLCVQFTDFETEYENDVVMITANNDTIVGNYSGSFIPPEIQSTSNAYVNFSSNDAVTQKGFNATFCNVIRNCQELPVPSNGYLNTSETDVGVYAKLHCHRTYAVLGSSIVSCQKSGKWSDSIGQCQRVVCPSPPHVLNGYFTGYSYYAEDEITLVCNRGYYIPGGRKKFRCSYAGVWSERRRMNCFAVSCGQPTTIANGTFVGSSFHFQDTVTFSCNAGYELQGSQTTTCQEDGTWSSQTPTCSVSNVVLSPEAERLVKAFQNTFYTKYATFTEEARPPPGSASRSVSHFDNVLVLDLIFVLDTSGSIGKTRFDETKSFVLEMAKAFVMGEHTTHMAAVAFGSKVYPISDLTPSKDDFMKAVNTFDYKGGGTETTSALERVKAMFVSSTRNHGRQKRAFILITDGYSNSNGRRPESLVPEFAQIGVERFAFGIGSSINERELNAIASPPSDTHVFKVSSFKVFKQFAQFLTPKRVENLCGVAGAPGFHGRVLNGQYSNYGAWPWLASIYIKAPFASKFRLECAGTLINKRWIISAAHCVYRQRFFLRSVRVKLGDYFRNMDDPHEQVFDVESMKFGGDASQAYDFYTHDNDIVLIKLSRNVKYNKYVRPICLLQPQHHDPSMTAVGRHATVVGWGYFRENDRTLAESPLEATITIFPNSECSGQIGTNPISNNMLCAKGLLADACPGDSGGPLMCQSEVDNFFTLCGIVSFGKKDTCQIGGYGVYTRAYNYVNTIRAVTSAP